MPTKVEPKSKVSITFPRALTEDELRAVMIELMRGVLSSNYGHIKGSGNDTVILEHKIEEHVCHK